MNTYNIVHLGRNWDGFPMRWGLAVTIKDEPSELYL